MRKLLYIVFPVIAGILIGAVVLLINPKAGEKAGQIISSASVSADSYSYAVAKAAPSVVNIYVTNLNSNYTSPTRSHSEIATSASGVIMSSDGYIVTNYHVVPSGNAKDKAIWAQTRQGTLYQAFVVGYDRRTDIAVLKVDASGLQPIPVKLSEEPEVGDVVLAIGNPNNLGQTVTHGIISATARSGSGLLTREQMNIREGIQDLIQTDAPINQGNSGGALVNTKGYMVGVNTASFNGMQTYGISFAVPTDLVSQVMNEIIKHGKVVRGYLGISDGGSVPLDNGNVGVVVAYVDPQGPSLGYLSSGDVITEANGRQFTSLRELIQLVSNTKPGSEIKFKVMRGQTQREVTVTLVEDKTRVD